MLHLKPAPMDYPYPHPDFLQLVFQAEAGEQMQSDGKPQDEWVISSSFRALDDVQALSVSSIDRALLQAALEQRQ